MSASAAPTVLIAGNPNAGKTTLFNALTGARAKVGNYPGVTVDRRSASLSLPNRGKVEIVDLPGTYSLTARSAEERVSVDTVLGGALDCKSPSAVSLPDAIVLVVDAMTLRRGLYFALQVLDTGVPLVLAINMMDEARDAGISIDIEQLAKDLGCQVVPIVARRGEGLVELKTAIEKSIGESFRGDARPLEKGLEEDVLAVEAAVEKALGEHPASIRRALAIWAMLSVGGDELTGIPDGIREAAISQREKARERGRDLDEELISDRYRRIDRALKKSLQRSATEKQFFRDRVDSVLVHPVYGLLVFALVMAVVFEALFSWAQPAMDLVGKGADLSKDFLTQHLPEGSFRDLLTHGVVAGVGNVLTFVPQIALLFVFITVLEDSGYLARVAFVIDRVMGSVGLNGKAFVPMLSGFACAIPAVMATRTMENRKDRLLTMLVIPLSSCSARLPVYVLVAGTVFSAERRVFGVFSAGAMALFCMYLLSVVASIGAAAVLRRTAFKGPKPSLILELPPYRLPQLKNILISTWQRVRRFLIDAGTVILALTIALWALLTYPKDPAIHDRYEAQRASAQAIPDEEEKKADLERIEHEEAGAVLRHSIGGRVGVGIEPALRPLGFDYRIGIGILGAFAAREVFVSTLGIVFDLGDSEEGGTNLRDTLREAKNPDGTSVLTPLKGIALMVFFVLACQCMSTLAVVRRESGSWKYPALLFGYMSVLAYVVTLGVYQIGILLGFGSS